MPRSGTKKAKKVTKKDKGVFIQTRVPTDEARRIVALATADDLSMSAYLRRLVRKHLAEVEALEGGEKKSVDKAS